MQDENDDLVSEYIEEQDDLEERLEELSETTRQEAGRRNAEYDEQVEYLRSQLHESMRERAGLSLRISELQS